MGCHAAIVVVTRFGGTMIDGLRAARNSGLRRRAFFRLAIAVPLLALTQLAAPASAQPPTKLTLQMALDMAERQNLDLIAARLRRAVASAGVRIAGQRPNPTVSFGAARDLPHENLVIDQPLELGSKRKRRIQLAQQESGLTEIDISTLSRQVRRNTREAYYRAALAQAESALQARAQQLAERLRQISQERFEAGAVAQLEVIRTEIEVSRAQADLQVAQQRERTSLSQLNALLNEPAPTQWELDGALEGPLPEIPLPELIQRSYSLNPELQRLAQEQKVEQSRLTLLKAGRIPNLDVQFGSDFNAPPDFQVGPKGQLSMTVPLFTRNQGEIAQSLANQRVLESATSATRRSVAGRVERAYFDLSALQMQVQLYRQRLVPGAQRVQGMAEESYRAGKTDILFVLDAQRNLLEVERNYLESLASLQLAYATLEESVGGPLQ